VIVPALVNPGRLGAKAPFLLPFGGAEVVWTQKCLFCSRLGVSEVVWAQKRLFCSRLGVSVKCALFVGRV